MINIRDLVYFEFYVNEQKLEGARNLFTEILLAAGINHVVPIARITFTDLDGKLSGEYALVDGAKLRIKFGASPNETKEIDLRVFSKDQYIHDGSTYQQVFAILDVPGLLYEGAFDKVRGTSVDALNGIFQEVGIQHESDLNPDDSQMWINCGETRMDYLKRVCLHSYVDDKSCIKNVIDFDQSVTKDLFKIFDEQPKERFVFQSESEEEVRILKECKTSSRSGFLNATVNYGKYLQQHSLSGDILEFDKVDPTIIDGAALPINSDIKSSLTGVDYSIGSYYDSGSGDLPGANVHENYYKAKYQNLRYATLFSEGLTALYDQFLDPPLLSLYDIKHGELRNGQPITDDIHSGSFILVNKYIVLRGTSYAEKYEFLRHFLTEEGNTPVVSGSNAPAPANSSDSALEQSVSGGQAASAPSTIIPEGVSSPPVDTNVSGTGNKPATKVSTVLDKQKSFETQLNPNIKANAESANAELAEASGKVQSKFDKTVEDFEKKLTETEAKFKSEVEQRIDIPGLQEKYGKAYDKLDAAMKEYQNAASKAEHCKALNSLESATLNFITPNITGIATLLNSRIGRINTALNSMYDQIDALLAGGDVQTTQTNKFQTECGDKKKKVLDDAALNKVKQDCLDSRDIDRLNRPVIKFNLKLNDLQRKLNELLCSLGQL